MADVRIATVLKVQQDMFGKRGYAVARRDGIEELLNLVALNPVEASSDSPRDRICLSAHMSTIGVEAKSVGTGRLDRYLDVYVIGAWRVIDEPITNISNRSDHEFMLWTEFGAKSSNVNIDGARAAEVVVTPNFLKKLSTAEDTARMLNEELEEFELFESEIENAAVDLRGVSGLINAHITAANFVWGRSIEFLVKSAHGQA